MNAPLPQLDFMQAVQLAISRISDMKGRSRRSEFWWTMLAIGLCNLVFYFIPYVGQIVSIALWVCSIPLMARRLHDTGRGHELAFVYVGLSVLMMLLSLIILIKVGSSSSSLRNIGALATIYTIVSIVAFVIAVIMIVFCCQDSQPFTNKYGPSPKYPDGPQNQQMYGQPPYGQQQYGPQQPPYNQQYGPQQPPYNQQYGPQQPPYNQPPQ